MEVPKIDKDIPPPFSIPGGRGFWPNFFKGLEEYDSFVAEKKCYHAIMQQAHRSGYLFKSKSLNDHERRFWLISKKAPK